MRLRFAGNIIDCSPVQGWSFLCVCAFVLSSMYFLSHMDSSYDDMVQLNDRDKELLSERDENNRILQIKDFKIDAEKQKVDVEFESPNGEKKERGGKLHGKDIGGVLKDVAENAKESANGDRRVWPNRFPNSWRQNDHQAKNDLNIADKDDPFSVMAMSLAGPSHATMQQVADDIIRNQNRAPDSRYNINVTFSDLTSLDREIPDSRPEICHHFAYDLASFPKVTIIIPFYNEALTMILRTIHSVLTRTPELLLEEIILVDDKSTDPWLKEPLDRYLRLLPKIRLIRNEKRVGLIVSRMTGARLSKAPVLVFQDAHTESNVGWLPPILDEIQRQPKAVYQPFVDGIDTMNLEYTPPASIHKGSFSWDLRYTWLRMSDHEHKVAMETGHPFFTPTLVGCAMAVDKEYFFSIGGFDEGLRVWGGENIELAWRTWMCGGKVTTVTCSRVGHVFKNFPYKFDDDKEEVVQKNLMRVAETWMDGMKKYFYASTRIYEFKRAEFNDADRASLQKRLDLRKKLGCKNFEWYMYNIIPEIEPPPMTADYYGEIMNLHTRACWEVLPDYYIGMNYVCYEHKIIPRNNFALTNDGLLRYKDKCVKIQPPKPYLVIAECPSNRLEVETFGIWSLRNKGHVWGGITVKRKTSGNVYEHFCVTQVTNVLPVHQKAQMPQIGLCEENNAYQDWSFTYGLDFSRVPKEAMSEPS